MPKNRGKRRGRTTTRATTRTVPRKATTVVAAPARPPEPIGAPESATTVVVPVAAPTVVTTPQPAPETATASRTERTRRRRLVAAGLATVAGLIAVVALAMQRDPRVATDPSPSPPPGVVVGVPGGAVVSQATPTPLPSTAPPPTDAPTPEPTAPPTPQATPAPVAATTPGPTATPAAPAPAPDDPSTPPPALVAVAASSPMDSVAAFYQAVGDGRFDDAYALWSGGMRARFEREENLDERFDETADITFRQLYVAEQTDTTATVQANFVETYDGGSSREFIGYWRLVRTDEGWLLDEPTY